MRLKNKSLDKTIYVYLLGNLKIPENTTVSVPSYFSECQVREAIRPFPNLILLDGYILSRDDIEDAKISGHSGVMSKDVYDTDYNNVVDNAQNAGLTNSSLEIDFSYQDFVSGRKLIGNVLSTSNIESVSIIVNDVFDEGFVTVGDELNNSRLVSANENDLTYQSTFLSDVSYEYSIDTSIYLYFSGNPTLGSGKVVVALN